MAKPTDSIATVGDILQPNDIVIERDTIVLLNVKLGRGATAANIQCNFRVMEIYEKHYNKWFMSKKPVKRWKKEPKAYKLEVRMLDKNALNEFCGIELVGNVTYGDDDICQIVESSKILDVVGKIQQTVL